MSKPIYVETLIEGSMDDLWERTQNPDLHNQWDLRFTDILYLPRESPNAPQRFLYKTRIGFGISITGRGESIGEKLTDGSRTSSLRFWSNHPLSLIREGSGYWRYIQRPNGRVSFLTWYDYEPRFGRPGQFLDRWVFRPLMGWATAWSFDALRLWIEKGVDPSRSTLRLLVDGVARTGLALCWIYQGLLPKLLFPESGEREILAASGFTSATIDVILPLIGLGQVFYGLLLLLVAPLARLLLSLNLLALIALGIGALITVPGIYTAPFSPGSLTISMIALTVVALIARSGEPFPSALRCRRAPSRRNRS
ncbi:MAG: DoxX-like family protein [Candidatus Sumerlaeia bacterium]|nr:DoxX-like family protein [Candidatus Sumerlaeia bacterium]